MMPSPMLPQGYPSYSISTGVRQSQPGNDPFGNDQRQTLNPNIQGNPMNMPVMNMNQGNQMHFYRPGGVTGNYNNMNMNVDPFGGRAPEDDELPMYEVEMMKKNR
jgi:hypothetical protein